MVPEGSEHDPEDANTVHTLGERKTRLFRQALQNGINPAAGAQVLLERLWKVGIKTAVGSSSENASAILHAAGLEQHFDVCVDGLDAQALLVKVPRIAQQRLPIRPQFLMKASPRGSKSPATIVAVSCQQSAQLADPRLDIQAVDIAAARVRAVLATRKNDLTFGEVVAAEGRARLKNVRELGAILRLTA
jgi:hypothetical protein